MSHDINRDGAEPRATDVPGFAAAAPRNTPLYSLHVDAGGKMVDFAGWALPIQYGSVIDEHHAVRRGAGMFDVSHMTILDVTGPRTRSFLSMLLANDIGKALQPGKALYSCMLNEHGGIVDDLIAYHLTPEHYRLVVNAATHDKDLAWINEHAPVDVKITEQAELALLAIQGPAARDVVHAITDPALRVRLEALARFQALEWQQWFIARTGYTGEDGYEIALPAADAVALWSMLTARDVRPCGLGARDTLRLEAGMNLYGNDMDEQTTPFESGLGWTVSMGSERREFIGRPALERQSNAGVERVLHGLVLDGRGVLRGGQPVVHDGAVVGVVTSGTFSPTLQKSIALARLPIGLTESVAVRIRDKDQPVSLVHTPFVKHGRPAIRLL